MAEVNAPCLMEMDGGMLCHVSIWPGQPEVPPAHRLLLQKFKIQLACIYRS